MMPEIEEDRVEVDEKDDASSDEDFNPDAQKQEDEEILSSSEDEQAHVGSSRGKRKRPKTKADDLVAELDSGDEATIQERKAKRRKGDVEAEYISEEDDELDAAGFVKTRSQRRTDQKERRPFASTVGSTVDVDAVWAKLSAVPLGKPIATDSNDPQDSVNPNGTRNGLDDEADYMTIKRKTQYAGQVTTEEKRVHKHSAEARLYLEEQEKERDKKANKAQDDEDTNPDDQTLEDHSKPPLRRPLKRPSRFEPNPFGEVKALPPHLQLRWPRDNSLISANGAANGPIGAGNPRLPPRAAQVAKLNTVDKSRHDWAGFVDKEGIADELDEYGRSKASYRGREDFLNRMEDRREKGRKDVRTKAR